jgi:hypothetical protein
LNEYIIRLVKTKKPETVEKLLELVQQKYSMPKQEIMEHIIQLQNQRKLIFKEHQAALPLTPKDYMLSTQATWYWIIVALALTTTATVFTIPEEAFPIVYTRYILGSLFVLLLPGYSLIKALFPTKELDNIERIALSIGMSLALVPITGLLLNYTPWGIRTTPITLSLLALTTTFATAALVREHQAKIQKNT